MLTPKNNLKQKISAAMDKMRENKVGRLEKKVDKVKSKMTNKPSDTMSKGVEKFKSEIIPRKKEHKTYFQATGQLSNDSRQRAMDMYKSSKNK